MPPPSSACTKTSGREHKRGRTGHDVSEALAEHAQHLPDEVRPLLPRWAETSRQDRELPFYGSAELAELASPRAADGSRIAAMGPRSRTQDVGLDLLPRPARGGGELESRLPVATRSDIFAA